MAARSATGVAWWLVTLKGGQAAAAAAAKMLSPPDWTAVLEVLLSYLLTSSPA
jgi:hypothetical protein